MCLIQWIRCVKPGVNNTRGAALLELALAAPLLILMTGGVFSFAINFRDSSICGDGSRYAARLGTELANSVPNYCSVSATTVSCDNIPTIDSQNLTQAAAAYGCQYLVAAGANAGNFSFSASIVGPIVEDNVSRYGLQVLANRVSAPNFLGNEIPSFFAETTSRFIIEKTCL